MDVFLLSFSLSDFLFSLIFSLSVLYHFAWQVKLLNEYAYIRHQVKKHSKEYYYTSRFVYFLLELLLVVTVCKLALIEIHVHEDETTIDFIALISLLMARWIWSKLRIREKRWVKVATNFFIVLLVIIICIKLYFDVNFFMAATIFWRRVVVKTVLIIKSKIVAIFVFSGKFLRGLWTEAIAFLAGLTWAKSKIIAGRAATYATSRGAKRAGISTAIFVFRGDKRRRVLIRKKAELLKRAALKKKDKTLAWYKKLPGFIKIFLWVFIVGLSLLIGDMINFFYPILPKNFGLMIINLFKRCGSLIYGLLGKLGLGFIVDRPINWINLLIAFLLPEAIRIMFKWKFLRWVVSINKWITVIDKPLRQRLRKIRLKKIRLRKRKGSLNTDKGEEK